MKMIGFKVANYRSIYSDYRMDCNGLITIVGPNNSGKTNILKAIKTFFTAKHNESSYSIERDVPHLSSTSQTSMSATFSITEEDGDTYVLHKDLFEMLDHSASRGNQGVAFSQIDGKYVIPGEITLYLTFSKDNGNPSYNVYKGLKRTVENNAFTSLERRFVDLLLSKFECIYVPSSKSVEELIEYLVIPFLKKKTSEVISPLINKITTELSIASDDINKKLADNGISNIQIDFGIPDENPEKLLTRFDFKINDTYKTSITEKGMGIQCLSVFSSFEWISKEKFRSGINCIWLIEEPESFLHPALYDNCNKILEELSESNNVFITTHALSFVNKDPSKIIGVSKEIEEVKTRKRGKGNGQENIAKTILNNKFKHHQEATKEIRNSLGVKFSDYFSFGLYNILVEGPYDREYLKWVLDETKSNQNFVKKWPHIRNSKIIDFGGCSFLGGFLNSNYQFIYNEVVFVSLFDGDMAGMKSRRDVSNRINNTPSLKFAANVNWVSIPGGNAIEGLFPDAWIQDAYEQHPSWIPDYGIDATGQLQAFTVDKDKKRQFFNFMIKYEKTDDSWIEKFIPVLDCIEDGLVQNAHRLNIPLTV
ncbi:ATP-dependent nuclease [Pantoea allii]|uniref:ATP-dependent nuclease n=1 Tax=Pantoea allii TaxID=574096 RepID=UPI0024B75326|nr:AAA family ATPase [Pantoea allii]MDJ0039935.1 AAA family ATPase [Pantoea allii]